jgi:hypothetical protein
MNTFPSDVLKCHEHGHLFRDCPLNAPPSRKLRINQRKGSPKFKTTEGKHKRNLSPTMEKEPQY